MRKILIASLPLLLASSLAAQTVVGTMPPAPLSNIVLTTAPYTHVNLGNPALVAGTVNKASVHWSRNCAANAFKIVFLRNNLSSLTNFTVLATRGPFPAVIGRNDVTLTPPVALLAYDLIGVVQLQPSDTCGSVRFQDVKQASYRLVTNSDVSVTGAVGSSSNYASGDVLGLIAYNSDPLLVRIVPAAGAVQGSGAFFRTSLQMHNPSGTAIIGKLVFHKAGQTGSDSDPSLAFTVNSFQTLSYADVVTSIGSSGLGSLDVFTNGGAPPIVTARIFSDGGAAGTSGFTEDALSPNDALQSLYAPVGILPLPQDLTNYRMNIGIRTLEQGATVNVAWYSPDGTFRGARNNIVYAANLFDQPTVGQFTGGATLEPGGALRIQLSAGSAIIYGSVTDNRTQDSSMRIASSN